MLEPGRPLHRVGTVPDRCDATRRRGLRPWPGGGAGGRRRGGRPGDRRPAGPVPAPGGVPTRCWRPTGNAGWSSPSSTDLTSPSWTSGSRTSTVSRCAGGCGPGHPTCPCCSSPPGAPRRTAWPASTSVPTTTWSSRSRRRSWWQGCRRSSDGSDADHRSATTTRRSSPSGRSRSTWRDGRPGSTVRPSRSPRREFALLAFLARNRSLALTRRQLLDGAWGLDWDGDERTVDVHVRQLRRKLGPALPLTTVWGVGYRLAEWHRHGRPRFTSRSAWRSAPWIIVSSSPSGRPNAQEGSASALPSCVDWVLASLVMPGGRGPAARISGSWRGFARRSSLPA